MKLFISHISEEANLALVLKDWIESSFAGQCEVFVSSDKDDIPAGSKWLEEIDRALVDAVAFIVLCSPVSLARPWINFETGCSWIKRVPVVPVCHSGQKKGVLPPPISMFQALEIEDDKFVNDLLSSLAKHLKFSKIPRIDQNGMRKDLLAAVSSTKNHVGSGAQKTSEISDKELPPEAMEILKALGGVANERPTARDLAAHFKMTDQRIQYFLDTLLERKLLYRDLYMGSPATYALNPQGRKYLFERGLL